MATRDQTMVLSKKQLIARCAFLEKELAKAEAKLAKTPETKSTSPPKKLVESKTSKVMETVSVPLEVKTPEVKEMVSTSLDLQSTIGHIGHDFMWKMQACFAFLQMMKQLFLGQQIIANGGIGGSFIRQLFELPMAMIDGFKGTFGNPIGNDVDVTLFPSVPTVDTKTKVVNILTTLYKDICIGVKLHQLGPETHKTLMLGPLEIVHIRDVTIREIDGKHDPDGKKRMQFIPHYVITTKTPIGTNISIDVIAWSPESSASYPNCDFDVNSYVMTSEGIVPKDANRKMCMFTTMHHIFNREAQCFVPTININTCRSVNLRQHIAQIAYFTHRRLNNITTAGYDKVTSIGHTLATRLETKEDCHYTGQEAPYLCVTLECGHEMSIMMLYSLVYKSDDVTCCPMCRGPFRLKHEEHKPSAITSPDFQVKLDFLEEKADGLVMAPGQVQRRSTFSLGAIELIHELQTASTKQQAPSSGLRASPQPRTQVRRSSYV